MRLDRCAGATDAAVDNIGSRENVIRVQRFRHVRLHCQQVIRPADHAPKNGCQIHQDRPCICLRADADVAHKARLHTTAAIRNWLIAILGDAVHFPAINLLNRNTFTEAKTRVCHYVEENPGGVVRPRPLPLPAPDSAILSRLRVVVVRYTNQPAFGQHGHRWCPTFE